jgi:cysteine desulfurase
VLDAMLPYFTETFGNPASASHAWGWKAQEAVEGSRREVASLIGASAREVVFTSGATESNNFAVRGAAETAPATRRRVVVSAIEHKSVLEASHRLEAAGWSVAIARVGPDGRIDLDALAAAVDASTALVSVMAANNEIGVIQPLAEIGAIARAAGALFHVDAAEGAG